MSAAEESGKDVRPSHRILIVEDEGLNASYLAAIVEQCGHTVCGQANTASDAIALAREHRPSVVLVDLQLAGQRDGIEAAREIRGLIDCALIFCTAYLDDETNARMEGCRPVAVLSKPLDAHQLEAALREC